MQVIYSVLLQLFSIPFLNNRHDTEYQYHELLKEICYLGGILQNFKVDDLKSVNSCKYLNLLCLQNFPFKPKWSVILSVYVYVCASFKTLNEYTHWFGVQHGLICQLKNYLWEYPMRLLIDIPPHTHTRNLKNECIRRHVNMV